MTPSFVVMQSAWNVTGNKSVSASWNAGDLIVVMGMVETNDSGSSGHDDVITTPTATGLTFSAIDTDVVVPGGSHCWGGSWQATASSAGSGTISTTILNHAYGIMAVVVATGTHNGVGAHTLLSPNGTTEVASIGVIGPNSAVLCVIGDWSVGGISGHAYTPTGASDWHAEQVPTRYTVYASSWRNQSAGSTSYGVSVTPSAGPYSVLAVEIKGSSNAAPAPWVGA